MSKAENNTITDSISIEINGKKVNLIFQNEPNSLAAEFIRKTLLNAHAVKII